MYTITTCYHCHWKVYNNLFPLAGERFVKGVGESVTRCDTLKREIIHKLLISPLPHSQILKEFVHIVGYNHTHVHLYMYTCMSMCTNMCTHAHTHTHWNDGYSVWLHVCFHSIPDTWEREWDWQSADRGGYSQVCIIETGDITSLTSLCFPVSPFPCFPLRKGGATNRPEFVLKAEYEAEYNPFHYHYSRSDHSMVGHTPWNIKGLSIAVPWMFWWMVHNICNWVTNP